MRKKRSIDPRLDALPEKVREKLESLRGQGLVYYLDHTVSSCEIRLASTKLLRWDGEGKRWAIFVDEEYGAAWGHSAVFHTFSSLGIWHRHKTDMPPTNLLSNWHLLATCDS